MAKTLISVVLGLIVMVPDAVAFDEIHKRVFESTAPSMLHGCNGSSPATGNHCDLTSRNWPGIDAQLRNLKYVAFDHSNLGPSSSGMVAKFNGANLQHARFFNATLRRTDFSARSSQQFTRLQRADFTRARLVRTNLSGAKLNFADFNLATLLNVKFCGANLSGALNISLKTQKKQCCDRKTRYSNGLLADPTRDCPLKQCGVTPVCS